MTDIIPVANRHRPGRGLLPGLFVALTGITNITALFFLSSGVAAFQAGRRNADPPFLLSSTEVLALLLWFAGGAALVVFAFIGRWTTRPLARGALLVCVAAIPMGCYIRPLPGERYEEGFLLWAADHSPTDAARNWNAALPNVLASAVIPSPQWPPEIRRLSPATVTQLPGGQGIVLEWGVLANWGSARKIAICVSPNTAPPVEIHYLWKQLQDGVYAAFEITN